MKRSLIFGIFVCLAAVILSTAATYADEKIKTFVSILPEKYFVERVGGDRVSVSVLVGPGMSPHSYEPTPRQMAELAEAKLFFRIGVPFENSIVPKIESAFKNLTVVDLRKSIEMRSMSADEAHDHHGHGHAEHGEHKHAEHDHHDHGHAEHAEHGHEHDAGAPDPHTWLDPVLVKTMAATICDALVTADPDGKAQYRKNLQEFQADLEKVNKKMADALAPLKGREIFVFHPAYGYFCERYGLKQVPVEIEGKEPSAKQLGALIERARKARVKVIFVQPQFAKKSAQAVAEAIDGAVVALDPLAPDYLDNLKNMAEKVKAALDDSQ